MTDSLLVYMFFTNRSHEIVFVLICKSGKTISGSQLVQNTQIKKEHFIKFWLNKEIMDLSRILLDVPLKFRLSQF